MRRRKKGEKSEMKRGVKGLRVKGQLRRRRRRRRKKKEEREMKIGVKGLRVKG